MNDLLGFGLLVVPPLLFVGAWAAFGWRYRKVVLRETAARTKPPDSWHESAPAPRAPAPDLAMQAEPAGLVALDGPAAQALSRAHALTRAAQRCYWVAGGMFWSVVVTLHLWAMLHEQALRTVPAGYLIRSLVLVALCAALPGLIVLQTVPPRLSPRRPYHFWFAYFAVVLGAGLELGWQARDLLTVATLSVDLAFIFAFVSLGMLLLCQRRLRSVAIGLLPLVLFTSALTYAMSFPLANFDWPDGITDFGHRPGLRWPLWALLGCSVAATVIGVWLFLYILRSAARSRWALLLVTTAVIGEVLDRLLAPSFPLGPLLGAVPGVVLQCLLIWLIFKAFAALDARGWLHSQALHFHLCWLYLGLHALGVLRGQLEMPGAPLEWLYLVWGVVAAAYALQVVLLQALLHRAGRRHAEGPPLRLLLLRVFNAPPKRERLLDALDDTWRRIGRIDLIAGTDLAMRTLGSWTLECFLLQRMERQFLRSDAEVVQRLGRLHSGLGPDLRFPVNEVFCDEHTWQAAVTRLAATADAVLLDLRGFTPANHGCRFELQTLIRQVPLNRVLVLTDPTTDEAALRDAAHQAWVTLPASSPNIGAHDPRLRQLAVHGAAGLERLFPALLRLACRAQP